MIGRVVRTLESAGTGALLAERPLLQRLAGGLIWAALAAICQRGGLLIVGYVIGQVDGATGLGRFSMALATATTAGTIAGAVFGVTATRTIAERLRSAPRSVGPIIGLLAIWTVMTSVLLALIGLLASEAVASRLLHDAMMAPLVRLASPLVVLMAANLLVFGVLAGFEAFPAIARINALGGAVAVAGALIGFQLTGISGTVVGWQIGASVQLVLGTVAISRVARASGVALHLMPLSADRTLLTGLSLPIALAALLVEPVNWFCATQLLRQPEGYAEFGVFQAANQWFMLLMFVPNLVSQTNLPILSNLLAAGDRRAFRRVLLAGIGLNAAVSLVLLALALPNAALLMAAYGHDFAGREDVFVTCLVTAVLLGLLMPASNAVIALGRAWAGAAMNAGWAAVFVACALIMVKDGADGLASARLIAYVAHAAWTLAFMASVLGQKAPQHAGDDQR